MMSPVRVVLVEDQALVREALGAALARVVGVSVVALACDADEGLAAALRHRPDVVVTDIDMPGADVFDMIRTVRNRVPETRVLVLSGYHRDSQIEAALAAGVSGYVCKTGATAGLLQAIRTVAGGGCCFAPEVEARLTLGTDGPRLATGLRTRLGLLSPREVEVLRLLADGHSKHEIAELTHLSERTVNRHCTNLMAKLDIHDRVGLTRYAIREGLVRA